MIIIYDITDNELPVATFDNQVQAAEWLGVTRHALATANWLGAPIKKRYTTKFYSNQELDAKEI